MDRSNDDANDLTPADATLTPLDAARADLLHRLLASGRLLPTGVDGLYGRDQVFNSVLDGIDAALNLLAAPEAPIAATFPPMLPRVTFDQIGYLRKFADLAGPVFSFLGGPEEHKELLKRLDDGTDYAPLLTQTDLTLTPACCYPFYATSPKSIEDAGASYTTRGYCFRHEPSKDPMRLQMFEQREQIRVAAPEEVQAWRNLWLERAAEFLSELGLDVTTDVASDPFFGRPGRLMKQHQLSQQLKIEFLVNVYGDDNRTACSSLNYHQDHFGEIFEIRTRSGEIAHSSCIGFGLERIAVALCNQHGVNPDRWGLKLRERLRLA